MHRCPKCKRHADLFKTPVLLKRHFERSGSWMMLCSGCHQEWVRVSNAIKNRQHSHTYFILFLKWFREGGHATEA